MSITGVSSTQERSAIAVPQVRSVESRRTDDSVGTTKNFVNAKLTVSPNAFEKEPASMQEKEVSEEEIYKAIEKANESFKGKNARFEYSIHEETKRIMVKVIDPSSDEVIKEIPAEKILDMVAKIWEISGMFVDEKR